MRFLGWMALWIGCAACGSRTQLDGAASASGGGTPNPMGCEADAECGQSDACQTWRCVSRSCQAVQTKCDDGDACTEDRCDAQAGCSHTPLTEDSDGDGHRSPRAGYAASMPGACGDDCDDTSALAHPGRVEVCDGVDNDCNGVVDDGAEYVATSKPPVRVSSNVYQRAARGGLAALDDEFAFTYTGFDGSAHGVLKRVTSGGAALSEADVTRINADSYAGPLVWSGAALATAWEDARQAQNYEIYFARFDRQGQKLGPDLRVTNADSFSLNVTLRWNQSEYVLAWDDRRGDEFAFGTDPARIFGQRIAADGRLLGENVVLIEDEAGAQSPALAVSPTRIGLAYTSFTDTSYVGFRVFDSRFEAVGEVTAGFAPDVESPSVYWVGDRFVVLWSTSRALEPGNAIWAASFDSEGRMLAKPQPITQDATYARSPAALSLGDRLLLVWADDHDGNYELYAQTVDRNLKVLTRRARLTRTEAPTLSPILAPSPNGQVAVLFDDWSSNNRQVYFTSLECKPVGLR
ncbi:MAG TPA: MopE-related protein [Polyangiaceae bacterium]|nr:MopE-related protein [Polyangiaceae bacterium]